MKIAFLQEAPNQNIGMMYLSAILKSQGHDCQVFVQPFEKDIFGAVKSFKPDVVGFSIITGAHHWMLDVSRRVKGLLPGVIIVAGGPHPTYFPHILDEPCIDVISRGEAELSFPLFIRRLEKGQDYSDILGLWVKKNGKVIGNDFADLVDDISSLPYPDHEIYFKYQFYKQQSEVPFSTTRGCPYGCNFCYNHAKALLYKGKGRFVRLRKVECVISEMEAVRKMYPNMRSVILYDDIIGIDRQWLTDFCDAYASRIGLPWFTSIRVDLIDEQSAAWMAKANCFCLSLGVETGDEVLRERVLGKRIPNSLHIKAARLLRKAGIKVRTSNMMFLPGEDIDKAVKTVDLNRQMQVDFAWAYTLQPYPGTEIYDYAVKNGYLSRDFKFDDIDPLGLRKPIIKLKDEKKILVVQRLFYFFIHKTFMYRLLKLFLLIPPNPLFDILHDFSLVVTYARYHQVSLLRAFFIAWTNYWGTKRR